MAISCAQAPNNASQVLILGQEIIKMWVKIGILLIF
jgi:hypothetical protein